MYTTVVFDLDGTLLDTLDDLTSAVNYALQAFSLPTRTKEEIRSFIGNGVVKLMERAIGKEDSRFNEIMAAYKAYYAEHCADETKPYEGVLPLLAQLKERGVRTAVLSNKHDLATKALAERYFPNLLSAAAGENEAAGIRKKPAPDALFAMMRDLGSTPAQTVYVGDSEVDIQTAVNAGVDCISVTWGFKDVAFLRENGARILVCDPSEIIKFCEA